MTIPKIIHQLWKNEVIPDRYAKLVETWRRLHPDWEYRLWTDADLRHLVATDFPDFLKTFDGFLHPICRADAGRYLVLKKYGGVYADLDMEALKPLTSLLDDAPFLIGLEPELHLEDAKVKKQGLTKLLCPSLIMCEPSHPFWDHVMTQIKAVAPSEEPLDMTGPFLLTRAYDSYGVASDIKLAPSAMFYPIPKVACWNGNAFSIEYWERKTRGAFATHYWDGSWFRKSSDELPAIPKVIAVNCTTGTDTTSEPAYKSVVGDPLVSCLMVTRDRYELARLSMISFRRQTYSNRELVVLDDGDDPRLAEEIAALGDPKIRYISPVDKDQSLGSLRNQAVAEARGLYVCQWDDDDLYDPKRIEIEMSALMRHEARAVMLSRVTIWMPARKRLKISHRRTWEGSMICEKAIMPEYPDQRAGEDTEVVQKIHERYKIAFVDMPRLYLYSFHGHNTWTSDHFEMFWSIEGSRYAGDRYDAVRNELSKRLPVLEYEKLFSRVHDAAVCVSENDADRPIGFNLFAHLGKNIGIGTAGRGTLAALAATRLPYASIDLDAFSSAQEKPGLFDADRDAAHAINIFHTNPDALSEAFRLGRREGLNETIFQGRYNIGIWAWESETTFPDKWRAWCNRFDEIWVPSEFVARALSGVISVPILVMPHVVQLRISRLTREEMSLPQDKFIFLTMLDGLSGFERKNTLGTIAAYKRAVPRDDGRSMLLVKARTLTPAQSEAFVAAREGRKDIAIRLGDISAPRVTGLFTNCDAYVSLHRSEGFGLTIAEAMEQGKPVIVTNYSGNLDFTSADNAYLVDAPLVTTQQDFGVYPAGTLWAEPDIDQAATHMRTILENREAARQVGKRGAQFVHANLNQMKIADLIVARLKTLQAEGLLEKLSPKSANATAPLAVTLNPGDGQKILILTPFKNAAIHLQHYARLLERLDYDPSLISIGLLEGDSTDGTFEALQVLKLRWEQRFRRIDLLKHDYGLKNKSARWAVGAQRVRRDILARARNRLLSVSLRDADWVLWLDADLVDYPSDLLKKLLGSGKEIVVPRCIRPDGSDFDLNTFRFAPERGPKEARQYMIDGIFQPPKGAGRIYLGDLAQETLATIDSVGGTALLIKADLHREGLIFPAYSHRGYIETEGLAMMARDMGYACWAMPQLQVVHSPD